MENLTLKLIQNNPVSGPCLIRKSVMFLTMPGSIDRQLYRYRPLLIFQDFLVAFDV